MKKFLELVDSNGKGLALDIDSIKAIRVNKANAFLSEIFCDFTTEPFLVKKAASDISRKLSELDFQFIK